MARAESALKAAETALALAQTNLDRTQISLPFAGRVESQSVDLGQYVNPGKVLGSVFGTDVAEVRLALTTNQLAALGIPIGFEGTMGGAKDGGLSTTLSVALGGAVHRWQGTLTGLDAAIDPATRTVYGTVTINNPYDTTRSASGMPLAVGLYVDAEIQGRLAVDAIQIASEGLRAGDEVFVLNGEGLLDIRQASVIHRSRNTVLLSAGVEAGERVIISAIRNPVRGMRLEAMDSSVIADSVSTESAAATTKPEGLDMEGLIRWWVRNPVAANLLMLLSSRRAGWVSVISRKKSSRRYSPTLFRLRLSGRARLPKKSSSRSSSALRRF